MTPVPEPGEEPRRGGTPRQADAPPLTSQAPPTVPTPASGSTTADPRDLVDRFSDPDLEDFEVRAAGPDTDLVEGFFSDDDWSA